ncbi:MAG: MBL fold metallo-hydrolase [Actinophytocola sp.]|nr:MBL fold metallo-hydrolase [Actinophytocola sp.]
MDVVTVDTPSLGDRSYLITDGEVAVVVDAQRDIDRILTLAADHRVRITYVLETHIHNDYVTGGYQLARRTGAAYGVAAADDTSFERHSLADGDVIVAGAMTISVRHTPGHTTNHLSFIVHEEGRPLAVFTGGSMLYGTVGRTDLVDGGLTDRLARDQYHSVRRLADELPDEVTVHPTHGFGSHCSASETSTCSSTIGAERSENPALTTADEEAFVRNLVEGLAPYPTYYAHMAGMNTQGPAPLSLTPAAPLGVAELKKRIHAGEWVIDLRTRRAFAATHLGGAVNFELRNDLPSYVGWVIPWGARFTLLADEVEHLDEAQIMLARIGFDQPAGAGAADPGQWQDDSHSYPVRSFQDLSAAHREGRELTVLDVRDEWEWKSGHHPTALRIPFYELPVRMAEIARDRPVWVYCATGSRAAVAASLLERAGFDVELVDDFCLPGDVPCADLESAGR